MPPQTTAQKPQTTRGEEQDLGPAATANLRRNTNIDYSPCLLPERKSMLPNRIIPSGWMRKRRRVRSLPSAKAGNQPNHQTSSHALYSSTLHSSSHFLAVVSLWCLMRLINKQLNQYSHLDPCRPQTVNNITSAWKKYQCVREAPKREVQHPSSQLSKNSHTYTGEQFSSALGNRDTEQVLPSYSFLIFSSSTITCSLDPPWNPNAQGIFSHSSWQAGK